MIFIGTSSSTSVPTTHLITIYVSILLWVLSVYNSWLGHLRKKSCFYDKAHSGKKHQQRFPRDRIQLSTKNSTNFINVFLNKKLCNKSLKIQTITFFTKSSLIAVFTIMGAFYFYYHWIICS